MPRAHLPEFRRRAVELANERAKPVEAWYNPARRHSYCQMRSPVDFEAAHAALQAASAA